MLFENWTAKLLARRPALNSEERDNKDKKKTGGITMT
jgi:hypothetical protein